MFEKSANVSVNLRVCVCVCVCVSVFDMSARLHSQLAHNSA